jgi:TolB-like protein
LSEDNASFAYKGKAVDIKHVGRELGVRYVLEGTLQTLKTHRREVVAQADVQPSQSP